MSERWWCSGNSPANPWVGGARCNAKGPSPGFSLLQVVDERFCPDVLSTAKEMSVANFRRVPKMPIYGTAQPSSKVRGIPWWAGLPATGSQPSRHPPCPFP